jgi:ATP-dependent DNA helicase RecG
MIPDTELSLSLQQRIALGEDSYLELKRVVWRGAGKLNEPHPDGLADELAAFANTQGGQLVLGVDDKTREVLGIPLQALDTLEQWLSQLIRDRIEPEMGYQSRHLYLLDAHGQAQAVVLVTVPKSLWVHRSPAGYLVRAGHEKRKMSTEYLARLFQQRSQARLIRFEELPIPDAPRWDQLPWRLVQPFLRPDEGSEPVQLKRLHLLTELEDKTTCLTVAGVLLCTPEPGQWIRGAYIQAVAYRGTSNDPADQLDAKDFTGPITDQIEQAFLFAMRHMLVPATKALGRVDYPQYSKRALFEAVVNAVAHRDYSIHGAKIRLHMFADRLELCVPGALPNTLSIEAMTRMSIPRNDVLCSLLSRMPVPATDLGRQYLMDRRGAGVDVILKESEKLSGQKPQYRLVTDMELQLTIYAAPSPHDGGIKA